MCELTEMQYLTFKFFISYIFKLIHKFSFAWRAILWILTTYRIVVIFSRTFHIPVHGFSQIFKISNFEVFFQFELQTVSHKTSLFPNTHLVSLNHSFSPFLMFLTNMSLTLQLRHLLLRQQFQLRLEASANNTAFSAFSAFLSSESSIPCRFVLCVPSA